MCMIQICLFFSHSCVLHQFYYQSSHKHSRGVEAEISPCLTIDIIFPCFQMKKLNTQRGEETFLSHTLSERVRAHSFYFLFNKMFLPETDKSDKWGIIANLASKCFLLWSIPRCWGLLGKLGVAWSGIQAMKYPMSLCPCFPAKSSIS